MPTNLNALIRYKTVNDCLSTGRGYTIEDLMEACSNALGEYRGRYTGVSERTLRDDLRVMKGEMLGINAPIVQRNGIYFYSDRDFHLINIMFTDTPVIQKAIRLLNEINKRSPEPEVEDMIRKLRGVLLKSAPKKIIVREEPDEEILQHYLPGMQHFRTYDSLPAPAKPRAPKPAGPTWGDLFRLITKKG